MNMLKILIKSTLTVLFLWGCEQKAEPIDSVPENASEEKHEQGYIDTH